MISKNKILLLCLFFAFFPFLYAAETVLVPENSLLFEEGKDQNDWTIKRTVRESFAAEVMKKEKIFLQQRKVTGICVDVYRLKIPGSDGLCFFPEVTFKKEKSGNFVPYVDPIDSLMFLGIFLFAMGLASLAGYFHLKSEKKKYLLPASLLFFFWGYASWYVGFISDAFITPSDEIHYFNIAQKLRMWDFTSMQYRYTIGFPILCIPFILFPSLQNWVGFFLGYMNFQTFILIPGLFLLLYGFFHKKMGLSGIQSFFTLLLWLILMVFYMPMFDSIHPERPYVPEFYSGNACFSLMDQHVYFSFIQMTWLGRNAMGDHAAFFLLLVLLYFSMKRSGSLIRFFVLSMGFGFLCLVRLNYIFFAPLLAFVFYDSFSGLWKNKRNYLHAALCGTAGFMIVFIWQFVVNKIQFGSPFVWPYSLHLFAPDRGFVWNVVPYGFKFLFQSNYIYMTLGLSSLFFIPDRKIRAILTLWIFPMLLFFCGYPIVFNSTIRFILPLYPAFAAAVVMNPVWKASWPVRIKAALIVFCSCVLCKSNLFFIHFQPWNLGKYGISNTVFIIIQCVICLFCCAVIFSIRKELKADYANTIRHVRFLILFTAVFFLGSVCIYLAGLLVLAAFAYGLRDTVAVIRQICCKNEIDNPSVTA